MSEEDMFEDDFEDFEDDFEEYDSDSESKKATIKPVTNTITLSSGVKQNTVSSDGGKAKQSAELQSVLNAMNAENNAVKVNKDSTADSASNAGTGLPARKQIKVGTVLSQEDLQKMEVLKKRSEKAKSLLNLISLNLTPFREFVDFPPKSEYDLYKLSFGVNSTISQTGMQCPSSEDFADGSVQTDRVPRFLKSVQAPDDLGLSASKKTGTDLYKINPVSFSKFLKKASQAVERLIEEKEQMQSNEGAKKSVWKFSELYTTFFHPVICQGRSIVELSFLSVNEIAVCYSPVQSGTPVISNNGLICVWNLSAPGYPSKVLVSEPELTCITFIPHCSHIVIAGTKDGSLQLWDLRESETKHKETIFNDKNTKLKIILRTPTYSTDWMVNQNHYTSVQQISPLGYNHSLYKEDSDQYQIASIDQEGTLIFWILVNLPQETTSDTDLGLSLGGGRVRLVNSGQSNIFGKQLNRITITKLEDMNSFENTKLPFMDSFSGHDSTEQEEEIHVTNTSRCVCIESEPKNPAQFLIGLDNGSVRRGSRFPKVFAPAEYHFRKKITTDLVIEDYGFISNNSISVTGIHYSIFLPNYFIVSFNDGSIGVYIEGYSDPIYRLTHYTFRQIRSIVWSPYVPSQFYVLDSGGELFLFDLLKSGEDKLVISQNISIVLRSATSETKLRPSSKIAFPQFEVHTRLLRMQNEKDSKKQSIALPAMAVGYNNGRFDVHTLNCPKLGMDEITTQVNQTKQAIDSLHAWNCE